MVDGDVSGHKIALGGSTDMQSKTVDTASILTLKGVGVTGESLF